MLKEISYLLLTVCMYMLACRWLSVIGPRLGIFNAESNDHINSLEVLRGIAAFLVFGSHSTMWFTLAPAEVIAGGMGNVGVLLFFMLTGHLFWGQITSGKFNANVFFQKRIRRLFPAMIVVVAAYTCLDWGLAGFPWPTADQMLGILRNFGFGFGKVVNGQGSVNDIFSKDLYLKFNVIWSLQWEWLFYLCLPLLATLKRFRYVSLFAVVICLMFMNPSQISSGKTDAVFIIAFWLGAFSSFLENYRLGFLAVLFSKKIYTILLFFGIVSTLMYFIGFGDLIQKNIRVPIMVFLIFPVFFYFVGSKPNKSILSWPPINVIGKISYSFYLWHLGICTYVVSFVNHILGSRLQSWPIFFITVLTAMLLSVTLAAITYRFIEETYLKKKTCLPTPRTSNSPQTAIQDA